MKIACVHYHFRTGGVTQVVANAIDSLRGSEHEYLTLSGEAPPSAFPDWSHTTVAGLAYRKTPSGDDGLVLSHALEEAARARFGTQPDLWHFHNHSLGKNVDLPGALHHLLKRGARVLLQIHDFAEDGRPSNYARQRAAFSGFEAWAHALYPAGTQVHYAVLNTRDAAVLTAAGFPASRLHLLPNAFAAPPAETEVRAGNGTGDRLILYPTRGIRRKNLGEMLFWAALHRRTPRMLFASTLRPKNPEEQKLHAHWEALATGLRLPARFGLGEKCAFPKLMNRAESVITSSVAEGFGMGFLEPFLHGKPLVGRDIPSLTADFRSAGIQLDTLYPSLPVPLKLLDQTVLRRKIGLALARRSQAYGRPEASDDRERAFRSICRDGRVDFGRLDPALQTALIRRAADRPGDFHEIRDLLTPDSSATVDKNRRHIGLSFSLDRYGQRLRRIYQAVRASPLSGLSAHDAEEILNAFLDPEDLSLLRITEN